MKFHPIMFLATALLLTALPLQSNAQNKRAKKTKVGPAVGTTLEDFSLNDQHGKKRTLSEMLEDGPVAVVFHRSADW